MGETVIQVSSLGKRIKGKTILEEISFEINKGDCVVRYSARSSEL